MTKNNALPPASQPWVRELEKRIKDLENKSYRTDSKVNVMSNRVMAPRMDLDALSVTEIRVGGEEPQVFEHEVQNYSINGNTITASTPPVPVQRGFIMEWEVDVTASVDYIQVSSSLDPEMYEDPEEPTGALAGEETTYFADASYMTEDVEVGEDEDEMFNPVPPIVSFTLHNPANTAFTFTVHAVRMRFIIPGEGGLRISQGGEIYFEDGAGHDRIIQEISEEQAQAIIETADNLKQAQQDLVAARTEAEQNFQELDDKLGEAFPGDNIFDVDLAIEQAKELAEQKFNDSITGTLVEYSRNSNETNPPVTGWSTTAPTRTPGTFIWMRTTISYGSGDTTTTDPVLLTGNAGAQGPQGPEGPRGPQGVRGPDGPQGQALYTWIKYAPNGNPTSGQMSESPVGMTYMGIAHNQTVQTEGTDPTAYSWSLIKGPQGDTGVRGPDGKDGQSLYTWVKYAPNGSPTASQITDTPQATSTHIGLAYNKTTASETTVPSDYTWSLIKGPKGDKGDKGDTGADGLPGATGVGISSTEVSYVRSENGSVTPSHNAGWQEQPPTPIKGQYLWTRTKWTYTDGSSEYGYSSAYWAEDGAKGNDGLAGKDGTKLTGTVNEYAQSTSGTTPPTSGWATQPPTAVPGRYMWTRSTWSYSDGTTEQGYTVGKIGDTGPQGVPGTKGKDGTQYYTWLKYAPNGNPTSGQMTDVPNSNSTHMGIALNQTSPTEGTSPSAYTWSLIKGTDGVKGDPGANGSSLYTWVKYAPNGSPTNAQITDLPQSNSTHIGLAYNKTTATESTAASAYTWSLIKGPKGDKGVEGDEGAQGVSVTSITPHFRRLAESATKPAKPSGMTPSGWVATEPAYARDTTVWRSDRIVFSNDQIVWTDVSKLSSYEAAKAAEAAALAYADQMKQEAIDAGAHDLANLQIGGRNYLLNSAQPGSPFVIRANDSAAGSIQQGTDEIGQWITGTSTYSGLFYLSTYTNPTFENGRGTVFSEAFYPVPYTFTQSYEVMSEVAIPVRIGSSGTDVLIQPNEWTKISATLTNGSRLGGITVAANPDVPVGTKLYHRNWKLEKGTKATDWSPAPEDVDAGISKGVEAWNSTYIHDTRDTNEPPSWYITNYNRTSVTEFKRAATVGLPSNVGTHVHVKTTVKWTDGSGGAVIQESVANDGRVFTRHGAGEHWYDWRDRAGEAQAEALSAINMANGKNAASYSDVADSVAAPGPTPSKTIGEGRRVNDMHRNRRSNGQIIGEWIWTGTAWTRLQLSDAMLSSLDVGLLTAGGVKTQTAVVDYLWGGTGIFQKLQVEQGAYIDGVNLKDGAVTSRTLNVVPESGTGGVEILPPGIRIIPDGEGAGTAVSLRVGEDNVISFAKDNENTFSVDESGNITGESLDVRKSLKVDGVSVLDLIDSLPRGVIAHSTGENMGSAVPGTDEGRIAAVTFRTPPDDRMVEVRFRGYIASASARDVDIWIRQSAGDFVKPVNSSKRFWRLSTNGATPVEVSALMRTDSSGWGWDKDTTITVGLFAASVNAGQSVTFHSNGRNEMTVTDMGPAIAVQSHKPWVPSTGGGTGGGTEEEKGKRDFDGKFYPAYSQSYTGGSAKYDWNKSMLFHGYNLSANGRLRSMAIFNRTAVNALTTGTGTEMVSGHIKLYNSHTWANSGMTVRVGYVKSYTEPPNTWNGTTNFTLIGSYKVSRGGVLTIPLTSTLLSQIKNGGFRGIGLVSDTNTASHYGYFNAGKTELFIKVRK